MLWYEDPAFENPPLVLVEHLDGRFNVVCRTLQGEGHRQGDVALVSPPWHLRAYAGDWTVAAALYKARLRERFRPRTLWQYDPAWVRDIRVVIAGVSTQIVDAAAALFDPSTVLFWDMGMDGPAPGAALTAKFADALRYAHARGMHAISYNSYRLISMPGYPEERSHVGCPRLRPDCLCLRRFGGPDAFYRAFAPYSYDRYGSGQGDVMKCRIGFAHLGYAPWRHLIVYDMLRAVHRTYGVDGWFFDTSGSDSINPRGPVRGLNDTVGEQRFWKELRAAAPATAHMSEGFQESQLGGPFLCWALHFLSGERYPGVRLRCLHPISGFLYSDFLWRWGTRDVSELSEQWAVHEMAGAIPALPAFGGWDHPASEFAVEYARLYSRCRLRRDWPPRWEPGVLACHADHDGHAVKFVSTEREEKLVRVRPGEEEVLLGQTRGVRAFDLPAGVVLGRWIAYAGSRAIGLDPARAYPYFRRTRTALESRLTITALPPDTAITEIRDGTGYTLVGLDAHGGTPPAGTLSFEAQTIPAAVLLSDGRVLTPQAATGAFDLKGATAVIVLWAQPRTCADGETDLLKLTPAFHAMAENGFGMPLVYPAHPGRVAVARVGDTAKSGWVFRPVQDNKEYAADFVLTLPGNPARLQFALGAMTEGEEGKAMRYAVLVNGRSVFDTRVGNLKAWQDETVDLAEWAGRPVLLSLVTDSRTGRCGRFASGMWAEPKIVAATPPPP
jgi:hypothetical protein